MRLHDERMYRFAAQRLLRALGRVGVRVTNLAYRHLVDIVQLPVRSEENWFPVVQDAIAKDYHRAMACGHGNPERAFRFERVGDFGLLVCGFFSEQHDRKHEPPDIEYYIRLGREAYGHIGKEPYPELTDKYRPLTDVMAVLAANYTVHRNQRIMALYETWQKSHDRRAARILARMGIAVGGVASMTKH